MPTYDVQAFRPGPDGVGIQSLADPLNNGQLVSGGQHLLQRVICRLFLQKGSMPYKQSLGTNFYSMLQVTGLNSEQDIKSAFAGAMLDLLPQLQSEESASDPPDERFQSAQLTQITITVDRVFLTINVTSLTGAVSNTTLPLFFQLG